jgi:phosphohistidine phosphatase
MKKVLIVRHAKSSWEDFTVSDFDRPLNDRGKKDAPEMAARLAKRNLHPDIFITSPAKRAKKTAEIFAKTFNVPKENIMEVRDLYEAGPEVFYDVISKAPVSAETIIIFSHNPGITAFTNDLTDVAIADMPTCAIFAVETEAADWTDFPSAPRKFLFFDSPKH